jgi:hypothetical protein
MKSNRSFTLRFALGSLLAICFNAGLVNAQTPGGKFSMPFEVHWGVATLPAGDYTFRLDGAGVGAIVWVYHGHDCVAMIRNQSYAEASSGRAALTVIQNKTGNTVTDLRLPEIGRIFRYQPHKTSSSAAERELAQIPVDTTGQ